MKKFHTIKPQAWITDIFLIKGVVNSERYPFKGNGWNSTHGFSMVDVWRKEVGAYRA